MAEIAPEKDGYPSKKIYFYGMKKTVLVVFIALLFVACNKKISASDISKINGYWEIEKVVFPDGKDKEYTINTSFDFFQIKNNAGFRKKVSPQLDGTFLVNDDFETVKIIQDKEKYFIQYGTPFAKWKEELLLLSDDELVTVNATKVEYHYKKAGPINILDDGKKTK